MLSTLAATSIFDGTASFLEEAVSPCQCLLSLTSLTFVFNKAVLAQCDNTQRKRNERPQKWYTVFFSFVAVRLTTHYRNQSPLQHGRMREIPSTYIWCSASIQRPSPLPFRLVPKNGESLRPRCVSFISEHGEGVATRNPCLIQPTYSVPQQLNSPSPCRLTYRRG